MPGRCSMPSAVLALPCGSRSITSALQALQRERRRHVDRGRRLADAALLVGDREDPLTGRPRQPVPFAPCSTRTARSASAPIGVSATRGLPRSLGGASMFHVKHRCARPRSGAARPCLRRPVHRRLLPARADRPVRRLSAPRAARRPRWRADSNSPRHISPPSHRRHPTTPSHADARRPRPRLARPSAPTSGRRGAAAAGTTSSTCPATRPLATSRRRPPPARCRTARSSARPRTTVTSRPRSSTTSRRKSLRRSSGSISVTRRSGRANASGIPGSPAPLPMSATRIVRVEQFGDGRAVQQVALPQPVRLRAGPISPRSTPAPARIRGVPRRRASRRVDRRRRVGRRRGARGRSPCFT